MELHQYGINELWRDGIDLINLKVIYKVRNVRLSFFTYLSMLISSIKVLPKCIAWYSFSEVILVLLSNIKMKLVNFKGYCQGQKVQCGPLLSIWAYISETVHAMVNVYLWHIYKVIYLIYQFTLWHLTLDDRKRSNQGHILSSGCIS